MRTKVHELDDFDGSDICKLQPFLVQCTLNFHNRPDAFTSDSDKVTFTLSYLKGTALDWFKPSLTSGESPPWLNDYSDFVRELKNNFGPHNPEGECFGTRQDFGVCMGILSYSTLSGSSHYLVDIQLSTP